jgi:hypothetical protein
MTGGWRKLHNEELHNFYSSPSVIRMIKSRRIIHAFILLFASRKHTGDNSHHSYRSSPNGNIYYNKTVANSTT